MNPNLSAHPNGCIRTGFYGYVKPYGEFIHGDLFKLDDILIARVCERTFSPPPTNRVHVVFRSIWNWFDDRETSAGRNSTLIADRHYALYTYEGELITRVIMEGRQ